MEFLKSIKLEPKLFYALLGIFVVLSFVMGIDGSFLIVFSIWAMGMIYSLSNVKRRIFLSAFLVAFFTFLIGGHFVYEYFQLPIKYNFGYHYYLHSNITMAVSLTFVLLGFIALERYNPWLEIKKLINQRVKKKDTLKKIKQKRTKITDIIRLDQSEDTILMIRKLSKWFYILLYFIWMYALIDVVLFVTKNSYLAYYSRYVSDLPFIINAVANITPYFFFLFLATMPKKKEVFPLAIMHLAYAVLSLAAGRRVTAITIIMFLFIYVILRHFRDGGQEVWIKKKYLWISLLLIPIGLVVLYVLNYSRMGMDTPEFSLRKMILGFFQQQGFSSSVMRLQLYYQDLLRPDAYYSFFGLTKLFRTNTLIKLIFNPQYDFSYLVNNPALALQGNSMAHSLGYIVLRKYLEGVGVGSSYIAELYHDFSYLGIIIGSSIYGLMMSFFNRKWIQTQKRNVWIIAIGFTLVEGFLKAPRWNFDIVFTYLLDLGMWSAFLGVYICCLILKNTKIKNYFNDIVLRKELK